MGKVEQREEENEVLLSDYCGWKLTCVIYMLLFIYMLFFIYIYVAIYLYVVI